MLNKLKNYFLEMLFPSHCVWCDRLGLPICLECEEKILKIKKQSCPFCNRINASGRSCVGCKKKYYLCGSFSYGFFKDIRLKEIIHQYKYKDLSFLSKHLGGLLAELLAKEELSFDVITFVPLSRVKKIKRGYNQAELLAKEVACLLKKDFKELLVKNKETPSQVGLRRTERAKNLKGSFEVVLKESIKGKRVLLVDDVLTTGATFCACAEVLKKAGAKSVWGITVARD